MLVVGIGLGVACRLVPAHYQGPCSIVVRALALFLGIS